jgi:hydroxymethylglutaryl-CoA lyase
MSDQVRIVEVGPRDGLQNEKTPVSAEARIAFVENLVKAGLDIIEVGSFVSPKAIPQMANSDQVLRAVDHHPGHEFHVLVPNEKGYEGAKAAGAKVIAVSPRRPKVFPKPTSTAPSRNRSSVSCRCWSAPRPMASRCAAMCPACSAVPMMAR